MNQSGEKFLLSNRIPSIICLTLLILEVSSAQLGGSAGTFTRLGFGARGMGMGNAVSSIKSGNVSSYYNPASSSMLDQQTVSASFGVLSLDRSLNTIFYSQPIDTTAGFALSILNSGTSNIDGRDNDGVHTENYSTSENQFALSFGLRIKKLSIGINSKIYYYHLFDKLSTTAFGIDLGILYQLTPNITIGGVFKDILTKYKWDTSDLYGQSGNSTTEKFPLLRIIGISYLLDNDLGILSVEFESSNSSSNIIRAGAEINLVEYFSLRAGVGGWSLKNKEQAHPTFGFSVKLPTEIYHPTLHYALVVEPYGYFSMHIISLSVGL